jgi:myo-inositol-1(or 4)-monophosphatase
VSGTFSSADLRAVCEAAARAAGDHARRHEGRRRETLTRLAHDVKLALDSECQQRAEAVILGAYPGHPIIGEEGSHEGGAGVPEWIVDPIDGTINFTHGLAYWCVSVAVREGGRMRAGVVYAPALGELFTATDDGPARCNGAPLRVSDTAAAADAMVLTGLAKDLGPSHPSFRLVSCLSERVQKIRIQGAAALDLCQVARGAADAFVEAGVNLWDVAAGNLIVERAGGRFEALRPLGPLRMQYLGTNGRIHDELRRIVLAALPPGPA